MRRAKVTAAELLEQVIPVASLDRDGLEIWKAVARERDEGEALAGAVSLLERLCDLGRVQRLSRTEADGFTHLRYRNLTTLDVISLKIPPPVAPSPGTVARPTAATVPTAAAAAVLPQSLLDAVAASSRRVDLAGALKHLCDLLRGELGCERVSLLLSEAIATAHAATLSELDDVAPTTDSRPMTPGHLRRQVEETGQALHVADLSLDPAFARRAGKPARGSVIVAPLEAEAYVYGVIELWRADARAFDATSVAVARFVAEFAAGLIKRRLEVETLIFIDQTTQIHNRRYFEEQLDREIERSKRTGRPMALLIADLDDFKKVNDTLGHAAGDSVLRQVARILSENARQVDIVARYGGEEFALILPDVTGSAARMVAERILGTIAEHRFVTGSEAKPAWHITASIGGARYPDDADTKAALVDRADRLALYDAKRAGKNRVVFWTGAGASTA